MSSAVSAAAHKIKWMQWLQLGSCCASCSLPPFYETYTAMHLCLPAAQPAKRSMQLHCHSPLLGISTVSCIVHGYTVPVDLANQCLQPLSHFSRLARRISRCSIVVAVSAVAGRPPLKISVDCMKLPPAPPACLPQANYEHFQDND